jgi:hypothetical protein
MTQKERALQLIEKFRPMAHRTKDGFSDYNTQSQNAKECAIAAVDEILPIVRFRDGKEADYWEGVREELNNINFTV